MSVADRADSVVVRFEPAMGSPQRIVFEPRHEGAWDRHDQVWTGCQWRTRGVERVRDVDVDAPEAEASV